jgi:hypothetical protein
MNLFQDLYPCMSRCFVMSIWSDLVAKWLKKLAHFQNTYNIIRLFLTDVATWNNRCVEKAVMGFFAGDGNGSKLSWTV